MIFDLFSPFDAPKPLHSWRVLILPYLEQTELYDKIKLDEPWDSEHNKQFHEETLSVYRCPENAGYQPGMICYSVVVGKETPFETDGKGIRIAEITDGLSNTALVVERTVPVGWMRPDREITFEDACKGVNKELINGIGSDHTGGATICRCDGSVAFLADTVDLNSLKALLSKAGGETVEVP